MPEEGVEFMDRRDILSYEEIERFVRAAVPLGINKIRITGGEPLVRRDLPRLIEKLVAIPAFATSPSPPTRFFSKDWRRISTAPGSAA